MPERIVFYRDGVSEGEYEQVASEEFVQIKSKPALFINAAKLDSDMLNLELSDAVSSFWTENSISSPESKITFIIVGKRHHVRFFPQSINEGDRSGNCPAGLVVDTEITSPYVFDFFLQSHGGLLGSKSRCFFVIHSIY